MSAIKVAGGRKVHNAAGPVSWYVSAVRFILLAALLASVLGATEGCISDRETAARPSSEGIAIRIVNRNWADMRVYLERDGVRALLGIVTSGKTADFPAPRDMTAAAGTLRLIGDPVGSQIVFASESFRVDPGQTVEWTIRVRPAYSGITIH